MKRRLIMLFSLILAMTLLVGTEVAAFADTKTAGPSDSFFIEDLPQGTTIVVSGVGYPFAVSFKRKDGERFQVDEEGKNLSFRKGVGNSDLHKIESDGTYIIKVNEFCISPEDDSSESKHVHSFSWQTITEPTQYSDGLAGEVCSCGATRNTQPISAMGYTINDYATKLVNASKPGQVIKLEFGEWNSFPKAFMEKVAAKSAQNVTFVFKYKWNHVNQEITIPAGTVVDTSLDWYGPAKMAELYGLK